MADVFVLPDSRPETAEVMVYPCLSRVEQGLCFRWVGWLAGCILPISITRIVSPGHRLLYHSTIGLRVIKKKEKTHVSGRRIVRNPALETRSIHHRPEGNPGANGWFLWPTPIQMPLRRGGGICGRLTYDLPSTRLQGEQEDLSLSTEIEVSLLEAPTAGFKPNP